MLLALSFLVRPGGAASATAGIKSFRSYISPADGSSRSYTIRTPAGYDGTSRLPAVLFLHGRGGSALSFQYQQYFDAADANGYVLLFWQGRLDASGLLSSYYVDGANGVPDETDVIACLDDALSHLAIDPARVHLVGFSQGAKGALLVGLKNPDRFASVTDGAGPTDAFEGQKWSPTFPDFRDAAGGDPSAGGAVLSRWFAQSPRFYLRAARNLPVALAHGTLDVVVPDSLLSFPYRNTHHVADTPGFSDEHGTTPTLSQLHAAYPEGYPFVARYPAGVGHDELGVLDPTSLFAFVAGKSVPARPARVAGVAYEPKEHSFYWALLARATAADGRPAPFSAELLAEQASIHVAGASAAGEAPPLVTIDLARAGLDSARPFTLVLAGSVAIRVLGVPQAARVLRDGNPVGGATLVDGTLSIPLADYGTTSPATIAISTAQAPVSESDLLVPALVAANGLNGARFETELVLANLGNESAELEALFLDGSGRAARVILPPATTRLFTSASLFAALGAPGGGAAPLRLRTLSGTPPLASARVFNALAGGGTYGLSFPVASAGESILAAGESARVVAGPDPHAERTNLSLFAPFEAAAGTVTVEGSAPLPFSLAPLERIQLDGVLSGFPGSSALDVSVSSGRVQMYATVVSNSPTNDPFRSPALPLARAAASWTVPAVASASGRNGARFTSDLALSAPSGPPLEATLTFVSHDGGTATASLALEGRTRLLSDVVSTLFPGFVPGYGAIAIQATAPLLAFDVTRAASPSGPASQDVSCVRGGDEATSTASVALVGLAESPRARSNVTLVDVGSATIVTLRLVAEDGERGTITVPLASGEFRQLDSVAALFPGGPTDAATLVVTPGAGGRIVAAGARIDNATNDPTGLASVPLPPR